MSKLLLVRHGQARLFSDDYDRLSALGAEQAAALATSWLAEGTVPERVCCGTLRRQRQSAAAVREVFADAGIDWPEPDIDPGLDEYPAEELVPRLVAELAGSHTDIRNHAAAFRTAANEQERYRHFHRLMETVMAHWVRGSAATAALPLTWPAFSERVQSALTAIRGSATRGSTTAVFTSGGPIGVSVQCALEAPEIKAMELSWRLHNGSVTQYTFSRGRLSLDRFNDTRHLPPRLLSYR